MDEMITTRRRKYNTRSAVKSRRETTIMSPPGASDGDSDTDPTAFFTGLDATPRERTTLRVDRSQTPGLFSKTRPAENDTD